MSPVDRILRLLMLAAAALPTLAGTAAAVPYQWRDEQGRMVYSDLPPPASIAAKRIIRSPPPPSAAVRTGRASDARTVGVDSGTQTGLAGTSTDESADASTGRSTSASTGGSTGATGDSAGTRAGTADAAIAGRNDGAKAATTDAFTTGADRELAYRRREIERTEQEKKESEESVRKLELARACSDAQGDIRTLLSGQRISRIDPSGERAYLSDEERAERLKAARKSVGERC